MWICMELMATCLDKLLKRVKSQLPEKILGKVTVAVSMLCLFGQNYHFEALWEAVIIMVWYLGCCFASYIHPNHVYFEFQTVKALNYLKEEHGVIHRGIWINTLPYFMMRKQSHKDVSYFRCKAIKYSTGRAREDKTMWLWDQWTAGWLQGQNTQCWLCSLHGSEYNTWV